MPNTVTTRIMKYFLLFLPLLFLLTIPASSQKSIEFQTIKTNVQKKEIKTMLIAGAGTTPARIFLENLAEELGEDLKKKNIQSEYQYIGSDLKTVTGEITRLLKEAKFTTILVINQSDTTIVDRRGGSNGYVSIPTSSSTPAIPILYSPLLKKRSKLFFDQEFTLQLFEINQPVSFWDASLNVYSDLLKKAVYSNISKKIVESFQENKLF